MSRTLLILLSLTITQIAGFSDDDPKPKRIHVIVALCDNEHQGIVPVNPKIGNGEDLENNLYWGCSDGMSRYFKTSKDWTLIETKMPEPADGDDKPPVLETLIFKHKTTGALLTAEAWRGSEIKASLQQFTDLLDDESIDLLAYIGHNGLMEFSVEQEKPADPPKKQKDAVVLCCKSELFFAPILEKAGARPILMTDQFMYPGSFLLKATIDGWIRDESTKEIRDRAAKAYAANQKIKVSSARGVFTDLKEKAE